MNLKTLLWVMLFFITACMPTAAVQEESIGTMCGGTPQVVVLSPEGQLHSFPTRTIFWDAETDTIWMGTTDARVFAFSIPASTLEQCALMGLQGVPVNDIHKWREHIWIGTDGAGSFEFDGARWVSHPRTTNFDVDHRIYGFATDRRNLNLLMTTWEGIVFFDGEQWEAFNLAAPDFPPNFHVILPISENEIWFGSLSGGTYHLKDSTWERFTAFGYEVYSQSQGWQRRDESPFPNNIRDIDATYGNESVAIVGDDVDGVNVVFLQQEDDGYTVIRPEQYEQFAFSHITAIEAFSSSQFIVTNWSAQEGGGVYYYSQGEVTSLLRNETANIPALDVQWLPDAIWVATEQGVYKAHLPFSEACGNGTCQSPESNLTCPADCGAWTQEPEATQD